MITRYNWRSPWYSGYVPSVKSVRMSSGLNYKWFDSLHVRISLNSILVKTFQLQKSVSLSDQQVCPYSRWCISNSGEELCMFGDKRSGFFGCCSELHCQICSELRHFQNLNQSHKLNLSNRTAGAAFWKKSNKNVHFSPGQNKSGETSFNTVHKFEFSAVFPDQGNLRN